jgi:integrase
VLVCPVPSCASSRARPIARLREEVPSFRQTNIASDLMVWRERNNFPGDLWEQQAGGEHRQGFRYHDLRHYFASLLIASGSDVKTVQARVRHASAKTTLDCYGHLWPDRDESTRAAVDAVLSARFQDHAGSVRAEKWPH